MVRPDARTDTRLNDLDAAPIDAALYEASKSDCRQAHGAVIARDGKVFAVGHNELVSMGEGTIHAEVAALGDFHHRITAFPSPADPGKLPPDLYECTLYSVRVRADMSRGHAKPCKGCATMASRLGIMRIVYTDEHGHPRVLCKEPYDDFRAY